jgi:hypothetical protein
MAAVRTKRDNPEGRLQRAICQHLMLAGVPGMIYFSVPNEARRSIPVAMDLKAKGLRAGVSDLVIFKDGCAFCLEVKAKGEKQSEKQQDFERDCILAGVPYACVDNIDAAICQLRTWQVIRPLARAA